MDSPEAKKGGTGAPGPAGSRAPAKGESSGSDAPIPRDDGATISDDNSLSPAPEIESFEPDATFVDPSPSPSAGQPRHSSVHGGKRRLRPGDLFGGRYEILQLLGEGGMGAVYKARDREVEHLVALKLIRPEMANHPVILARFKQELLTARQVTHRNVIRIYDIAEAESTKYITMEFVEGSDLRKLLHDEGKLAPEKAIGIIRQICHALEAAHGAGVIHRDLKPQNIMQETNGRILVMDFGLARSLQSDGMTESGVLLGTIEYMSPEQALGKHVDARSDIFTLGLIFYELLTGKIPYKADTAMASLLLRNQERAVPVTELDKTVPQGLSDIVGKCLERDLTQRYQSVQEILADLDAWEGKRPLSASVVATAPPKTIIVQVGGRTVQWKWIGVAAAAVLLATAGWMLNGKIGAKPPVKPVAGPQVSLAILPFRNGSGDANLDWLGTSLADMLSTDVGQSAQLRTISSDRLHQVLRDLRVSTNADLDPETLKRVAEQSNADTVVSGQYAKFGNQIRIDAMLLDLKHDRRAPLKIEAANENAIPATVDGLAELIRKNLALSADVLKELKASSFQPASKSPEALRNYNQGVQSLRDGKNLDAQKTLESATKEDPAFALAFSKLAQAQSSLGHDSEAELAAQKAVDLSQNLPQAERYLIAAIRARVSRNYPEAIKAYENLAKASPDNADVQSALAGLYEDSGQLAKAGEYYQKILAANPKDVVATLATGRIALVNGNAQASLEPLNRALSLSIQIGNDEQKATSLHDIGYAYEILNKPEEALSNYEQALTIRRRISDKRGVAKSLNKMARVEAQLGKNKAAGAHFEEALRVNREIGDKRGLGDVLLDLGNFSYDAGDRERSRKLYLESLQIQRDLGNEGMQSVCLNNIGSVYFSKGEYQDALTYFQQALQLREKAKVPQDIVESVHNVAETSVRMGQYDQAVSQYMKALELRRSIDDPRGAAIESYSMGTLFDYQGRFGAAVASKEEALKSFRNLKDRTFWLAEILGGYAESLTLAGRGEESKPSLEEALSLSRELKNDGLLAQTLMFQGDAFYYRGDANSARPYYERALQSAMRSKEPEKVLIAQTGLARADLESGRSSAVIAALRSTAKEAEDKGFAYVGVEISLYTADAMLRNHDVPHARQELEQALRQADRLGLKPLSAKAHYLLAAAWRASANQPEAQQHYRSAAQLLDGMRKEAGAEKILQRSDFKTIYDEASHWAGPASN